VSDILSETNCVNYRVNTANCIDISYLSERSFSSDLVLQWLIKKEM